jgi:hypothetical protein
MPSTFTVNKGIEQPASGSYNNAWAAPVNADWEDLDNALGGNSSISVTSVVAGTYPLSLAQYQPPNIAFTGVLTANLIYALPAGVGGLWSVFNNTTGAFSITFAVSGGGSFVLPQGQRSYIVCDGTNIASAQSPQVLPPTIVYSGTDTGTTNAYAVALSNFSYVNGIVLYFIASTTNTGPSTLTINGVGSFAILNQNFTSLSPNQIIAGSVVEVLYSSGSWILLASASSAISTSGTFSATVVGGSSPPLTCAYSIDGSTVNIDLPYCAFTSNNITFLLNGLPALLRPASNKLIPLAIMQNNGVYVTNAAAGIGPNAPGVIVFYLGGSAGGWTGSGIKGIGTFATLGNGVAMTYNLL